MGHRGAVEDTNQQPILSFRLEDLLDTFTSILTLKRAVFECKTNNQKISTYPSLITTGAVVVFH